MVMDRVMSVIRMMTMMVSCRFPQVEGTKMKVPV